MDEIVACQQIIEKPLNLFHILSKKDNILMFCAAKDGLKTNSSFLHNDIPTKKRYYKALKQLKDAGLIEKSAEYRGTYFHTTYGTIVYQREIVEMAEYKKHSEKMKMIDNLKKTKKHSEQDILKLIQDIIDNDIKIGDNSISAPHSSTYSSSHFASEIINTYEGLTSSLFKKIAECNSELLIATRLASEELINEISLKAKVGVKVKILADTKLVQGYFESQSKLCKSSKEKDDNGKNRIVDDNDDNNDERIKVIGNPWYPNSEGIERRVCDIPFGIIVIDGKEAGVELTNRNNTQNFFAGVMIKDENFATSVKELYLKIWNSTPINENPFGSHDIANNIVSNI